MLEMEALRKVLEEKGLDFDQVLQELQAEQAVLNALRSIGSTIAGILDEGWVTLEVEVTQEKVTVHITNGTLRARTLEIDRTQSRKGQSASGSSGTRDGKGPRVASLLQEAARAFGLSLKEWQIRSVSFHFPEIVKSLIKLTNGAIKSHPSFRQAIDEYRQWHPERELPQVD